MHHCRPLSCERRGKHLAWLRRYDSWQPTYNPSTRRMEQRIVTIWRRLPVTGDWQRTYEGDEPGMQARSFSRLHVAPAWRLLLQASAWLTRRGIQHETMWRVAG